MPLKAKPPKQAIPSKPRILVYGPPGVGKTTWALSFPDSLLIDCEGGANLPHYIDVLEKSGALYLGLEDGAGQFDTVIQEIRTMAMESHDRKTVIIDGFTKLFANEVRRESDRLEAAGKDPAAFGADHKPAKQKTRKLLQWLDQLSLNTVVICHSKPNYDDDNLSSNDPDCPSDLTFDLNLVIECFFAGTLRKARVIKSRYKQFGHADVFGLDYESFQQKWKGGK